MPCTAISDAANPQLPFEPAACLDEPIREDEMKESLQRLHNGRPKLEQGLPAKVLRYASAKLEPEMDKPAPTYLFSNCRDLSITAILKCRFSDGPYSTAAPF